MQSCYLTKPLLAVALVFAVEVQASGAALGTKQTPSSLMTKTLHKVAAWGAAALFFTTTIPCDVSAQSCNAIQSTRQAAQMQEQDASYRIPLYEVVHALDYNHLKMALESGLVDATAKDKDGNNALDRYAKHLYTSAQLGIFYDFGYRYGELDAKLQLLLDYGVDTELRLYSPDFRTKIHNVLI